MSFFGQQPQTATTATQSGSPGMGALLTALTGISMISSIAGGASQQGAARKEALLELEQGRISELESERDARRIEREGESFAKMQTARFAKSGVLATEGSPLIVVNETRKKVAEEAEAQRARGRALKRLRGRRADILHSSGRNALLGGFTGAFLSGANLFLKGKQAGLFKRKGSSSNDPTPDFIGDIIK